MRWAGCKRDGEVDEGVPNGRALYSWVKCFSQLKYPSHTPGKKQGVVASRLYPELVTQRTEAAAVPVTARQPPLRPNRASLIISRVEWREMRC